MSQIRSTRSAATLAILTSILLFGCRQSLTEPTQGSVFRTSQESYDVQPGTASLPVTFIATNTLSAPITLDADNRNIFAVEKKVGDSWQLLYTVPHLSYGGKLVTLLPGESRSIQHSINVSSGPGQYRARFAFGYKRNVPGGEGGLSNEFEVRLAQ
jgi:hypothetical protein